MTAVSPYVIGGALGLLNTFAFATAKLMPLRLRSRGTLGMSRG